jgi:hypothetical protein
MPARVLDNTWIKQSFMIDDGGMDDDDLLRRQLTTASFKYTDTSPGGNFICNPPPQFCRNADIKTGGIGSMENVGGGAYRPSDSKGMGRYYSEAIDDNNVSVVMRFGVPQYNSLSHFFANFYSAEASAMARTGRGTSAFFKAGQVTSFVLGFPAILTIQAMMFVGQVAKFFSGKPASKYYFLKPTMALYWNAVNTMVNNIAVNMGIIPRVYTSFGDAQLRDPHGTNVNDYAEAKQTADMHAILPEIFSQNGGIDVYHLSTRAQRLADLYNNTQLSIAQNAPTADALRQKFKAFQTQPLSDPGQTTGVNTKGPSGTASVPGIDAYLTAYMGLSAAQWSATTDASKSGSDAAETTSGGQTGSTDPSVNNYPAEKFADFFTFMESELHDGAAFIQFKVDNPGTVGESFSNSTKESDIQSKINSMSSSARSTRFDAEDGNVGGGAIGDAVTAVVGSAKDFLAGVASNFGFSGVAALAGSAFVDIPQTWDSSTAQLPTASYTVSLRSPYGNKISRLTNLYIPLCMLLAGALPLATGKQSYTSPFICELYCKGRTQIRLGIIDSMSVTRGAGNTGWTQDGEPMGIDISFSVKDMSTVMHMPVASTFSMTDGVIVGGAEILGAVGSSDALGGGIGSGGDAAAQAALGLVSSTYDDDNAYTDYMAVLGALSFTDQVYTYRKWKLNMTKQMQAFSTWRSSSHIGSFFMSTWTGRQLNAVTIGTNRTQ